MGPGMNGNGNGNGNLSGGTGFGSNNTTSGFGSYGNNVNTNSGFSSGNNSNNNNTGTTASCDLSGMSDGRRNFAAAGAGTLRSGFNSGTTGVHGGTGFGNGQPSVSMSSSIGTLAQRSSSSSTVASHHPASLTLVASPTKLHAASVAQTPSQPKMHIDTLTTSVDKRYPPTKTSMDTYDQCTTKEDVADVEVILRKLWAEDGMNKQPSKTIKYRNTPSDIKRK